MVSRGDRSRSGRYSPQRIYPRKALLLLSLGFRGMGSPFRPSRSLKAKESQRRASETYINKEDTWIDQL